MSYNPVVKVYYISASDGGPTEDNRLVPAPKININQELIYANDIVIGYTPIISINGYATSIDMRNVVPSTIYDFDDTVGSIQRFKNIVNGNGGTLLITDSGGQILLKATGGTIRSFSIQQSDNRWVNYAPYSTDIEFNELWIGDCDGIVEKSCGLIYDGLTESPQLLDMKKHRVKSFTDSFSVEASEDTMYNSHDLDTLNINNHHLQISYTINATGKHYFSDDFKLMPSWEQAKRFVQFKLIEQIKNRLTQTFMQRSSSGCSILGDLSSLYSASSPAFIDGLTSANFGFYNETISCEVSETEGSFSATYNALLKRKNTGTNSGALHTFSKTVNTTDGGGKKTTAISISGNVQGLIEGGLLKGSNVLELPSNGQILSYNDSAMGSKYSQALSGFNDIATKQDLKPNIKLFFGITNQNLNVSGACVDPASSPKPASHSVSHNYIDGSIEYNTSYNTDVACGVNKSFTNISVGVEDSVDIVAEFIVPGRAKGPIIQKINSKTPKKITLNVDGTLDKKCCYELNGDVYDAVCAGLTLPSGVPGADVPGMKLTQDQFVYNPIDGSYSISRAYTTCCED